MIYARIADGRVAELISIPADGPPLAERFHPSIVAACVPAGPEVREGWLYDGAGFVPPPPPPVPPAMPRYVPVPTIRERMEVHGTWGALAASLAQDPAVMLKVLSLREGIAPDDAEARAMIAAAGDEPDIVLAP